MLTYTHKAHSTESINIYTKGDSDLRHHPMITLGAFQQPAITLRCRYSWESRHGTILALTMTIICRYIHVCVCLCVYFGCRKARRSLT